MQKMGWTSGVGLGINEQGTICHAIYCHCIHVHVIGRKDPVPLELKDDNMGLGRFQMEVGTMTIYTINADIS